MSFIELASGTTHYELIGPEDGQLVVLLHGGTIPMWTWDYQVPALVKAGMRVLRYDMLGKGKSACPAVTYDRDLYRQQLLELLEALNITQPTNLVGFSFGGGTATNFTAHYPQRVAKLALVSPVLNYAQSNLIAKIIRLPLLGKLFFHHIVMKKMLSRVARMWVHTANPEIYEQRFLEQLKRPEFEPALHSFMCSDALEDYTSVYRSIGNAGRSALLIWGSADQEIPGQHIKKIRELLPATEYHEFPNIRHGVVYEAVEQLNSVLIAYLQGKQTG